MKDGVIALHLLPTPAFPLTYHRNLTVQASHRRRSSISTKIQVLQQALEREIFLAVPDISTAP